MSGSVQPRSSKAEFVTPIDPAPSQSRMLEAADVFRPTAALSKAVPLGSLLSDVAADIANSTPQI